MIDYAKYRDLMFSGFTGRTPRGVSQDAQLWKKSRAEIEEWLRARETQLVQECSAATTGAWDTYRAKAAYELAQAGEFWREQYERHQKH
jgi:hypothetical protein